ncbi:Hypothetical protein SRAE_1000180000 [Strongyloides ratti]|uniref:Uncharacterized protein n=1 Tax=Strongyloides ratti TaxID=34506 RepID=A0A090L7N3_STRRB|nr:Hypothetical protein SRAE_1000180000 [Strongyloides ratti]CEF63539.1 Hypothetical protein SRAE_1000180000 [Strongyloides ratti]
MAYYRKSSPIPGYTGHIPGSKFHVGGCINRKGNVNDDGNDINFKDYFNRNLKNFDNFLQDNKYKDNENKVSSLSNFQMDDEQSMIEENEKEISRSISQVSSYRENSILSDKSIHSKISNESNNSIKMLSNNNELIDKDDRDSLSSYKSKKTSENVYEDNEVKRPNTVGKDRKEMLRKKMQEMKPTGIWDKKPIPYESKIIPVEELSPKEKKNPFEGAEKGWWSEGQALVNMKNVKTNNIYSNSYSNNSSNLMSNRSMKNISSFKDDFYTLNNDEE